MSSLGKSFFPARWYVARLDHRLIASSKLHWMWLRRHTAESAWKSGFFLIIISNFRHFNFTLLSDKESQQSRVCLWPFDLRNASPIKIRSQRNTFESPSFHLKSPSISFPYISNWFCNCGISINYVACRIQKVALTDSTNSGLANGRTEWNKMQWPRITSSIERNLIESTKLSSDGSWIL